LGKVSSSIEVSVLLPSYLEEENLRLLLPRIKATLDDYPITYEIVVIDTTTPLDATPEACEIFGVKYINRQPTNSFGDAVRTGIGMATGEWIIFMDADGSHFPEFIPKLLLERERADLVIASRYVNGGITENSWLLTAMSKILNWTYAFVLNLRVRDVSNSFKLYRSSQLKALTLKCNNFDVVEEILFKLVKTNKSLRIVEVPFSFKKRMFGETKRNLFLFIITYLYTIFRLRFMG
jgi:dolichol-phosphate mannosyltransferase